MNKFAAWMKSNEKKQIAVAKKLGISQSSLHDIMRQGQLPNLKVAYEIEKYTHGEVTLYDWIDQEEKNKTISKANNIKKEKKIKQTTG